MASTGCPSQNLKFIVDKVEEAIPAQVPDQISILRLDTDWYQSTYHELNHLYPRLSKHGVMIIDDYGYWKESREATDRFIEENNICIYLDRVDPQSRVALKLQS